MPLWGSAIRKDVVGWRGGGSGWVNRRLPLVISDITKAPIMSQPWAVLSRLRWRLFCGILSFICQLHFTVFLCVFIWVTFCICFCYFALVSASETYNSNQKQDRSDVWQCRLPTILSRLHCKVWQTCYKYAHCYSMTKFNCWLNPLEGPSTHDKGDH
jgi:hypothetical protein